MVDSGSSVHLLRKSDLTSVENKNVGPATERMRLSTANGIILADTSLNFYLEDLDLKSEAFVTESAPEGIGVLSQGKTVRENKCSYWWRPIPGRDDTSLCTMYLPDGTSIDLCIEDDVPLLTSAVVAAAVKSPCNPTERNGDYRLEKVSVSAPSLTKEPDANAPSTSSPRSTPKAPKPHQPRMSDEADKAKTANAGIYTDFFVEIFAGTAGLVGAVKVRDHIIYTFELKDGKSGDIMNKATYKHIKEMIRDKHCIGVWFGMPCATLSCARHGRDGGP